MSKRICIWGDSIAYGAGDIELGGWVNRLALYLRKEDREYRAYNLGISGDISEEVLQRFEVEAEARELELIIFAIGINDTQHLVKENKIRVDIEDFKNNIKELIIKARQFSDKIIFIDSTPVDEDKTSPVSWHINRSYNNNDIEKYNKIIEGICSEESLQYIDIYKIFKVEKNYKELLYDGLHPNSEGHKLMFEIIKDKLDI